MRTQIEIWVKCCQGLVDKHRKLNYPGLCPQVLKIRWGKRYAKIIQEGSVWAFVDMTTGDILKPASWKAPAKHARGNILDGKMGMGWMTPYGPAYLK